MRSMGVHGGGIASPRISPGFRSGPAMGVRTFAPPGRVFVGRPGVTSRGFITTPQFAPPGRRIVTFSFGRLRHDIFFSNDCFVFPCHHRFFGDPFFFGNPFFFGGAFGSPFFGPSFVPLYVPGFSSDYYQPPPPQPVVVETGTSGNDVQLAMQIQRLSDEIADLRGEQALQRMQSRPAPPAGTSMSAVPPAASTTFVFRDGRRVSAQNYAITGQTLWILSEHTAKKFSLADLDRAATEQVNAASGVELHLPGPAKH